VKTLRKKRVSDFQKKRQEYAAIRKGASRVGSTAQTYRQQAASAFLNPAIENPFGSLDLPVYSGSEGLPMSAPRKTTVDAMAPLNFVAEEALTPANYVPLGGLGMMRRGAQITQEALPNLNRAQENAGLFLSSPRNYIPNFYGPTDMPEGVVPNMVDRYIARDPQAFANKVRRIPKVGPMIANQVKDAKNAEEVMQGRTKIQDFVKWAGEGTKSGLFNLMDPDSRALYYSTGVNPTTRDVAQAMSGGTQRDISKAIAQGQQNIITNTRLGRQGPVDPTLDTVDRISYMSDTVPFRSGVYSDLVNQVGARNNTPQRDLDFFEEHIGNVWKVGKGEKAERFADAASPVINVKTPTTFQTGNHAFDFAHKGPVRKFAKLFTDKKTVSNEEMLAAFKKESKLNLHPKMGKTDEEILAYAKENGGFYFTGSLHGTAITEGGVNYVGKITPRGRITAVVSDENNFLENVPVVGKAVETALPNRIVNATPPMIFDASSDSAQALARTVKVPAKDEMKGSYEDLVMEVAGIKADPQVVRGERLRSAGMLTTGGGLLARGQQEEEERGR
jgi:hypothetical protein